ncbi:MAG: hypothetical protein AMXMBFR7_03950 [Planctomycetota bacterium]
MKRARVVWLIGCFCVGMAAAVVTAGTAEPSKDIVNLAPMAIPQAERCPLGSDPVALARGRGPWFNAQPDEEKKVHRGPVSSASPSWYILTWPGPQKIRRARVTTNGTEVSFLVLRAEALESPALAPAKAWRRLPPEAIAKKSEREGVTYTLELPEAVSTRAFKIAVLEVAPKNGQVAWLRDLSVWGAPPAEPIVPPEALPPVRIAATVPVAGEAALVLEDAQGRRVKNLFAQVPREAGPVEERWNLKNEQGQYVAPGTYRWKLVSGPKPELVYQVTPYPNVEAHSPDSTPWWRGPADGWLSNHGNQCAIAMVGEKLYIGAGGTEGGHALIECDTQGRKLWGSPQAVNVLFSNGKTLFFKSGNEISRFDAQSRKSTRLFNLYPDPERRGRVVGLAAKDEKIYVGYYSPLNYLDVATSESFVDLEASLPKLQAGIPRTDNYGIPISPRRDFLSYFRLKGGFVGGDPRNTLHLQSTEGRRSKQYIVLSFKEEVPLGSLVFPTLVRPGGLDVQLSVLKPGASYPPKPHLDADWLQVPAKLDDAWMCVPLPEGILTRALRITFSKPGGEMDDALMDEEDHTTGAQTAGLSLLNEGAAGAQDGKWRGQIEGMRLLRMRHRSLSGAKVSVNSGTYDVKSGVWDAQRKNPLSSEEPGIMQLAWEQPQRVRGLAIKEIDGERTEVDVWTGAGEPTLDALEGWEPAGTYLQPRRNHYQPDSGNNAHALYLDGVLDFGRDYETRAIRLRVVKQWGEKGGRPEGVRHDRGGTQIEPARCRVYGVAALQYLGGEPPVDPIVTRRLAVHDAQDGKLLSEHASPLNGGLAFRPTDGALFGRVDTKVVQVDDGSLQTTDFVTDLAPAKRAGPFGFDPQGRLYVFDCADDRRNVRVYGPDGKFLNEIGKRGRMKAGPYDPEIMEEVCALTADGQGNFFAVYPHENPRRIMHFKQDGAFVQDFLGNTNYGGGGVLDPYDKSRLYFADMRFHIDWETGKTRLDSLMSDRYEEASVWGSGFRHNSEPIVVDGRRYIVSAPLSHGSTQNLAVICLYDETAKRLRLCAAVGTAGAFPYLAKPEFLKALGGKPMGGFQFVWTDRNGDGLPQVPEVAFEPLPGKDNRVALGRFDANLGLWANTSAGSKRYEPKSFLTDGTPEFEAKPMPFGADFQLPDGNHFRFGHGVNEVLDPAGKRIWSYPAQLGMDGLKVYPWAPGKVDLQYGLSGTARKVGELGDIFVIHANNGQMNLWTADGLLAGHLTLHQRDPRAKGFPAEHARGTVLENLSLGQEHFHHHFCQTADGKCYVVAGHASTSVMEVSGLDLFRRASGELVVTAEMIRQTREWEASIGRQQVFAKAQLLPCRMGMPSLDGEFGEKEWPDLASIDDFASFGARYNAKFLYLAWEVKDRGPFQNGGEDFRRLFKTGAAVDVKLGADPLAPPDRKQPVAGDVRLLIARFKGKPVAVLYRAVAPGAPADARWETSTPAGGTAVFEQVTVLKAAQIALRDQDGKYTIEASIPLADLGLKPEAAATLKMDWSVMMTDDGHSTRNRQSWADLLASGVADEPTEARLDPSLWGHLRFIGSKQDGSQSPGIPGAVGKTSAADSLLEEMD